MTKKNYQYIFCTLALATSLIAVDVNSVFCAPAEQANAAAQVAQIDSAVQAVMGRPIVGVSVHGVTQSSIDDILAVIKIKTGDLLTEEAVEQERNSIYELGKFLDVYVGFEPVPEGVKVIYTVVENPILTDIVVEGNKKMTTEEVLAKLTVTKGEVLNTKTLNANARAIEEHYREQGYIFMKVTDVSMGENGVLTLKFNEGMLEGFAVKGNDKTKERVITREMRLKPGEAFNVKDARRSMQRVYNLGFFEDVNMKLNPGKEPNAVILETDVVEKRTGTFTVGGGYSKSDGVVGIIGVGDTNFRGTGDAIHLNWEFGGNANKNKNYQFSYTRPWLDSKQTSGSFRIYNTTNEYDDYEPGGDRIETYDKNARGVEVSFGRAQSEYSTNYIIFKNRTDRYEEHVSGTNQPELDPNFIEDNFGNTRSISFSHVTDTRDNIYAPSEGSRASMSLELAGFGGDFSYNKLSLDNRQYFKVGRDHVIATKASIGYASGDMPKAALFKVGGQDTLRGYEDEQFQGNKMVAGTVEYRFPIVKKVKGVVFTDIGDSWGGRYETDFKLHVGFGVGIQMDTPIGPIRLDYGRGENGGKTHFNFGGSF